jgi:hypothetical protein
VSSLEYPEAGSTDDTPSTSTASQSHAAILTPTSAIRRPGTSNAVETMKSNSAGWTDQSPYEDQGNPFANNIPASVPSFDFISPPPSKSPSRTSPPPPAAPLNPRGRAALPSQQARFSSYPAVPAPAAELDPGGPSSRNASGPAELPLLPQRRSFELPPRPNDLEGQSSEGDWQQEASFYSSHAHGGNFAEKQSIQPETDLESVSGSVRRRYDGSGWD